MKVKHPVELTCQAVVEIVADYLDGRLVPDDRVRFEQHLHACNWCMTYLQQLEESRTLLGRLRDEEAPVDEADRQAAIDLFRRWRRSEIP